MPKPISVVIITKNAAETLAETLTTTTGFAEVVVYDNGSNDATLEIAQSFGNVALHRGEFMGFGPTKNHAIGLAKNDWILALDADESLPPELAGFLRDWQPSSINFIGIIRRDNYMMGKHVNKGGWGGDYLARLFNRQVHRFSDKAVHESVPLHSTSAPQRLPYPMKHDAVRNLGQFLTKIDRYSEIHRHTRDKTYPAAFIVLRSLFAFFRSYVLQGGVLAGWRGLIIAWNDSNGVFFKYMKVYADRHL